MKLIINLLLIQSCMGFFTVDSTNQEKSKRVANILRQKYKIPSELIRLRDVQNCEINKAAGGIAHFCINKKGELLLLSFNKDMIENSLSIFKTRGAQ